MMNFGEAIQALKDGKHVARAGWNGEGMWLWLRPAHDEGVFSSRQQYPERAYIVMKDATDMFVPWLASQTDMLAEDWEIVT